MAVNTAARRNSALKFGTLRGLPLPSGSVEEAARADGLFLYRGLYDSGTIPEASFPCYSAAVLKLTLPYAQVARVTDPTATVRIVLAPYADVRTR